MIIDDYFWWRVKNFSLIVVKFFLIDLCDELVYYIMFDDNFRVWEFEDSIVDIFIVKEGSFYSVDLIFFDNICVVKVDFY